MKVIIFVLAATVFFIPGSPVQAQQGRQGTDWDRVDFTIGPDVEVYVYGRCETRNPASGNTTTIEFKGEDFKNHHQKVEAASIEESIIVSGEGSYRVLVQCSNEKADAARAKAWVEKAGGETVD